MQIYLVGFIRDRRDRYLSLSPGHHREPHSGRIGRPARGLEVAEARAAAKAIGMGMAPVLAVAGEISKQRVERDVGTVFLGEPGEAITARAAAAVPGGAHDHI